MGKDTHNIYEMEQEELEAHIYFTKWNSSDVNSTRNYHLSICEISNKNRVKVINHYDCMNSVEDARSTLFYYYPNIPYYFN